MPKTPTSRSRHAPGESFSFRWGIPILDNLPFTVIYHFLLDHYAELGLKPEEMMFIIHLSQFRYETPDGQAKPGLARLAERMGYTDVQQVRRIKHRLLAKQMLRVTPQAGFPDIYDVAPFAAAAFRLWQTEQQDDTPIQLDRGMESERATPIQSERGGVSNLIGEKEKEVTIRRKDDSNHPAPKKRAETTNPHPPSSPYIAAVIGDFSRELGDGEHSVSNITQAHRLWRDSGLSEADFVAQLQAARQATRRGQGMQGSGQVENKMAYFFTALRRALGVG